MTCQCHRPPCCCAATLDRLARLAAAMRDAIGCHACRPKVMACCAGLVTTSRNTCGRAIAAAHAADGRQIAAVEHDDEAKALTALHRMLTQERPA